MSAVKKTASTAAASHASGKGTSAARTTSRTPSRKTMSIGLVLQELRGEFPDVTVSKIRFLESEGLITPQRTSSGYRRFTSDDVDRLRFILTTQRDNYLPLKVIREQLDAMDSGTVTPFVTAEKFRAPVVATRLTDSDVAEQADVSASFVEELVSAGLLKPDASGFFTLDDVQLVTAAHSLTEYGLEARHLKVLRTAAQRESSLIAQLTSPVARSKGDTAKQRAEELGHNISAHVVSLHAMLLKNALRDEMRS